MSLLRVVMALRPPVPDAVATLRPRRSASSAVSAKKRKLTSANSSSAKSPPTSPKKG